MLIRMALALAGLLLCGVPQGRAEEEIPDYSMEGGVSGSVFEKRLVGSGPQPFPTDDSYLLPMISTDPWGRPYSRACKVSPSPVISVSCN